KLVLREELSVRKTEALVRAEKPAAQKQPTAKTALSFEHQKLRADLRLMLGRNVELKKKEDGSGKIEIDFMNEDDLKTIIDRLNN
ncbi:MAG: ParB family chromosome partitioning protein, partial [Flavobacteriales bacterium]